MFTAKITANAETVIASICHPLNSRVIPSLIGLSP